MTISLTALPTTFGKKHSLASQRNTEDQCQCILINEGCKLKSPVVVFNNSYTFSKSCCIPSLKPT